VSEAVPNRHPIRIRELTLAQLALDNHRTKGLDPFAGCLMNLHMGLFAIGDIHGRFDLLRKALVEIDARSGSANTVVFLGDYIDRGYQSREVVNTLMAGPKRVGDRWICLKGNHEQMMLDTFRKPLHPDWWLNNGGEATMESFRGTIPEDVLRWIEHLPLCHQTERFFFVHAGIRPGLALEMQDPETMLWIRDVFLNDNRDHGKHIVHGHTPRRTAELLANRTNLDSGAVFYGKLSVGRFDVRPSVFEVTA
jgi:serine/threonine protein phosphatase 1